MIKRLDIYLLKSFFLALFVVTMAVGLTISIVHFIEELRDFIDHQVPIISIIEYFVYFGGWVVKSFLPMFILIACLFSVSILARRNEILAMKASGLSLYRISAPFILAAVVLAAGHFYYNEFVFPPANQRLLEIKEFTIERKSRRMQTQVTNIYRQIKPGYFYTIGRFNVDRREGSDVRIYKSQANHLSEVITADRIFYQDNEWLLVDGTARIFSKEGVKSFREFGKMEMPDIEEKPTDFARKIGEPGDMGLEELKDYIKLMKRTGGPYAREAVDLGVKYAFPLASIIVVLISIPFASNPRRGGLAVSISVGALISLIYFVLFRVLQSAGYNEKIPRIVAVWGVDALFFVVGVVAMVRARK